MKKLMIFGGIIVLLFGALAIVTNMSQANLVEGNPYGKNKLHPETIKLLNDPLYGNLILPTELEQELAQRDDLFVYFFQSTCPACKETTPVLVPVAEQLDIDLKKYNLLEFNQGWADYQIEFTPTLVYFHQGEEVDRITGMYSAEEFTAWFEKHIKRNK